MKFISLFAGIGGFDLGLERAGWECVAQVEIDDWCQQMLSKHWPDVPKFKDVKNVGRHNLPATDAIVGGFPCQPHSVAGKRKGASDDRNLWPEYLRIIEELRPRWIIGENVLGLRTTMLDEVLSTLDSAGYTAITLNLPAVAFNAPHLRERLFIVAHAKSLARNVGQNDRIRRNSSKRQTWKPRRQDFGTLPPGSRWELYQPPICRTDDGIPHRVDRLRGLGNAVVPQVAEWIGRIIMQHETNLPLDTNGKVCYDLDG